MESTENARSIRLLQRALNALNRDGRPSLALDGAPGPRTASALGALLARRGPAALRRALAALR